MQITWGTALLAAGITWVVMNPALAVIRAWRKKGKPAPDTSDIPGNEDRNHGRWLYYFHASHCGHCKTMTPVVKKLAETHANLLEISVDKHMPLARAFGISATPSLVVVENGVISQIKLGGKNEQQILAMLTQE